MAGYSQELADALGLAHVLPLLPEIRRPDGDGGRLTAEAAATTGLPEGTPVGVGRMDVLATGVGLGAVDDGQGWLILGTTGYVGALLGSASDRRTDVSMISATGHGMQVLEASRR